MHTIYTHVYKSRLGTLIIGDLEGQLCMLDWEYRRQRKQIDDRVARLLQASFVERTTPFHKEVIRQLEAYLDGTRTDFDLPVLMTGSDFQKKVWKALLDIPYGRTMSYLNLSRQLGDEKAIRAVATANGANAISIVIPCHRVIGSNGDLTGYAGGLPAKHKLLQMEGALQQSRLFDL
ncbi:MAG: methylated-DNA--[protein]-cysteine S-methyltransferase [Taibaiella sp.]|nr:methylated-DNA--[protein]-cysteine S-methyltransferase [Taibaiella sp.]